MPGFDGTGPWGMGPMTGGGRGFCSPAGFGRARGAGRRLGLGRARGMGRGFGSRWGYPGAGWTPAYRGPAAYAPRMSGEEELDLLQSRAESIRREIQEIEARMSEIEKREV